MMTAESIGAEKAVEYARYLQSKTVAPSRGDYYLGPSSEAVQAPGRWHMQAETLARLGISSLDGRVEGRDFVRLMEGRHPDSGVWLRAAGAGGGRGGGIDVCFSAPKSVSVVWALADPWQREQLEAAHGRAVEQALGYMRERVGMVRRRHGPVVLEETALDVLAAEYRHTTARGVSGAEVPDPQLHSHVVITGAVRDDGCFVAVASRPVFRSLREVGAYYRCALAHELADLGYPVRGATGKGQRYFEVEGVPREVCERFSDRSREIARAGERFRAEHGRAPERGELRALKLENRRTKTLKTRTDLDRAWRQSAEGFAFGPGEAARLIGAGNPHPQHDASLPERVERVLSAERAVFEARELRAVVLEQAAGELSPGRAVGAVGRMVGERWVLPLTGGKMTTLTVRAREQAIERHAAQLAKPAAGRDVGHGARRVASVQAAERLGAPLSEEQELALLVLTGPERGAGLIGPAGTGKGVVIDAAARAEQHAGRRVLGVAVAGATAERLGTDSPALRGRTLTVDSLIHRAKHGTITLDERTTVVWDEAGMADTRRLHELTGLIDRTGAKLILVGDGRQLPSIGPGGMFDLLTGGMPVCELEDVRRTMDPEERRAWAALRAGEPERALAHYQERGQLHFADSREQAAEDAVQAWAKLTLTHDPGEVALIADGSNQEIDRLNARAQHLRAGRGELGEHEVPLRSVHYGLREHDRIMFTGQHYPKEQGEPRVENGTRGEILHARGQRVRVRLDGSARQVTLTGEQCETLRLAYASHIYRQQGATVTRSVVLTGGWQTAREPAYVNASRAREGTDWHLAREELGTQGTDTDRIARLAEKMRTSRAQTPSLAYEQAECQPEEPGGRDDAPFGWPTAERSGRQTIPEVGEEAWERSR